MSSYTPPQFDQDELVEELREVADRLGHAPSVSEINSDPDSPSARTFIKYFGSWNEAKEAAGLETYDNFGTDHTLTKVELVRKPKKEGECYLCGESAAAALTFHHPDSVDKVGSVSSMATNGYSREELVEEIEKCVLLCANCHKRHHAKYDPLEVDV